MMTTESQPSFKSQNETAKRPSIYESYGDLALSVASILCYAFFFLALFNSAKTTADFKAKCLSENGEFTKGYVLIIPIQTCTYPKSTKT